MKAKADLENKDFKKTLKVSWLAKTARNVRLSVCYMENIISKAVLAPDDDFKQYIRKVSMVDVPMVGECNMASLKKGDIIQIQRKGFFICDSVGATNAELHTGLSPLLTLIYVPDGSKSLASLPAKAKDLYEGKLENAAKTTPAQKQVVQATPVTAGGDAGTLWDEVANQGNKIRQMKADKAEKTAVMAEVQVLQKLKEKFKAVTGVEWNPNTKPQPPAQPPAQPAAQPAKAAGVNNADDLDKRIRDQGMTLKITP